MRKRYRACPQRAHEIIDDPGEADAIVFFESSRRDERDEIFRPDLRAHDWVRTYPDKCFVADGGVSPVGWLPGAYTSMPLGRFDRTRFRAMGYLIETNPRVAERAGERGRTPSRLCTFRGARMIGAREAILDHARWGNDFSIAETPFLKNWSAGDKRQFRDTYVDDLLDSRFVLCPRGYATSTFRMYETMRLGRVPVVLSDEWVPPDGPDWNACVVRVPEGEWDRLPSVVRTANDHRETMARAARKTWESWVSEDAHAARILDSICELASGPRPDERKIQARWRVREFVVDSILRKLR
jgi:hypothetical protein